MKKDRGDREQASACERTDPDRRRARGNRSNENASALAYYHKHREERMIYARIYKFKLRYPGEPIPASVFVIETPREPGLQIKEGAQPIIFTFD